MTDKVTLMAVGDVMIQRDRPETIFDGVRSTFAQADLLLGNQEGPTTDRGDPLLGKIQIGSRHVRGDVRSAAVQAAAGFSAMTLANNHMMDFGAAGLEQTIELLREQGIAYAGAGANLEQARRPAILESKGVKIAMLGYTTVYPAAGYPAGPEAPGVATLRVDTAYMPQENHFYQPASPPIIVGIPDPAAMDGLLDDIRRARQQADLVVVQFHWGVAHQYGRISGYMKEMGRAAIDAGADLILGNHSHQLFGFEVYRERLICYCLNHFALEMYQDWRGWCDAVILKAEIENRRFSRLSLLPVRIDRETHNPMIASGAEWQSIRRDVEDMSQEFGTTFTEEGGELVIGGPRPGTPAPLRAPAVLKDRLSVRSYPLLY